MVDFLNSFVHKSWEVENPIMLFNGRGCKGNKRAGKKNKSERREFNRQAPKFPFIQPYRHAHKTFLKRKGKISFIYELHFPPPQKTRNRIKKIIMKRRSGNRLYTEITLSNDIRLFVTDCFRKNLLDKKRSKNSSELCFQLQPLLLFVPYYFKTT